MLNPGIEKDLPAIPAKRYFTIGEVRELCSVKPHVLRYWEKEISSIRPSKSASNQRRYRRRIRAGLAVIADHGKDNGRRGRCSGPGNSGPIARRGFCPGWPGQNDSFWYCGY